MKCGGGRCLRIDRGGGGGLSRRKRGGDCAEGRGRLWLGGTSSKTARAVKRTASFPRPSPPKEERENIYLRRAFGSINLILRGQRAGWRGQSWTMRCRGPKGGLIRRVCWIDS